ncbi:MAG: hypothetical protein K0R76_1549 [Alphaproteobacteria bacterium]|jgi:hypothetical protein|nr:hypothetical protein [Alphaproteobacteria bacterium]MDF3034595.1 hypothetical protein [Alphaproteobacteria bacterium]
MKNYKRLAASLLIITTALFVPKAWGMDQAEYDSPPVIHLPDCYHTVQEMLEGGAFTYHLVREVESDPLDLYAFVQQKVPIAFLPGTEISLEDQELNSFYLTYARAASAKSLADHLRTSGQGNSGIYFTHYDDAIVAIERYLEKDCAIANNQASDQELSHRIDLMAILGVSYYNKASLVNEVGGEMSKAEISSLASKSVEIFERGLKTSDTLASKNEALFQEMQGIISCLKTSRVQTLKEIMHIG